MSPFSTLLFTPLLAIPDSALYVVQIVFNILMLSIVAIVILNQKVNSIPTILKLPTMIILIIVGTAYAPVQNTLLTGQVNIFLLTLIILDTLYLRSKYPKYQGFLVGVVAGIKIVPMIFIVYYLLTRQYRAALNSVVALVGTIAVGFLISFQNSISYWLELGFIRNSETLKDYIGNSFNQSINGFILRTDVIPDDAKTLLWLLLAGFIGLVVLITATYVYRQGKILDSVLLVGFASLLCSPLSWIHHGVWVFPFMVMLFSYSFKEPKYFAYWVLGSIFMIKQFLIFIEPNIIFSALNGSLLAENWWIIVYLSSIVYIASKNLNSRMRIKSTTV